MDARPSITSNGDLLEDNTKIASYFNHVNATIGPLTLASMSKVGAIRNTGVSCGEGETIGLNQLDPPSTTIAHAMRDQAFEDVEMAKEKRMEGEITSSAVSQVPKGLGKQLIDGACILLNIASTVTLVFLNNWYVHADDGLMTVF